MRLGFIGAAFQNVLRISGQSLVGGCPSLQAPLTPEITAPSLAYTLGSDVFVQYSQPIVRFPNPEIETQKRPRADWPLMLPKLSQKYARQKMKNRNTIARSCVIRNVRRRSNRAE